MKLKLASVLLLEAAASVDAFHPSFAGEFETEHISNTGGDADSTIRYQSPPYNGVALDREGWEVKCSSSHKKHRCENAVDGRSKTFWQNDCSSSGNVLSPNSITVNLGSPQNVSGLTMLPRQDDSQDGQIAEHRVYLSLDGQTWGDPIAYGTWGSNKGLKLSVFDPKPAQHVMIVADGEAHGKTQLTSICDLNVYATNYTVPVQPGKGVWGPTIDLPVIPVASAQENTGNLILWSAWADDQFFASPGGKTATTTWDPLKKTISQRILSDTQHDMFCPGISMDGDGNIVVSGGADSGRTSIYNGTDWLEGPNMKVRRGYQASTTLSDGRIFVIGGSWSGGSKKHKDGEVYDPAKQTWTKLPGADVDRMLTHDKEGRWRADNHGWLFGWKNNSIFQAGPSVNMHWYSVENGGGAVDAGKRLNDHDSMSGNAVMYDATEGKIITFGGQEHYDGSPGSNHSHLITLGDAYNQPQVQVAGNGSGSGMNYDRVFHTSVVLPDGTVFIAGGQEWGKPFLETGVQFAPELYYPHNDSFVPLQKNNMIRVYHSISMLLPDATVLNGGGGLCGDCAANHYDAQIFTPPYLLTSTGERAIRPKILTVHKKQITVGGKLQLTTDSEVSSASLIRLGTATHTVNTDQRRIPLALQGSRNGGYSANVPADPGVALPGYYMLFVLNSNGVPSEAEIVKLELPNQPTLAPVAGDGFKELEEDEEAPFDVNIAEGIISVLAATTSRFWKTWKSALMTQT